MDYIQIYINDKGFARITFTTKDKIEKLINDPEEFNSAFDVLVEKDIINNVNCEYQGMKYIFIKGKVLFPKAVSEVTTYEIE